MFQVPSLGGTPRELIFDVDSPVAVSPDGKRLAYVRQNNLKNTSTLLVANADGTGETPLAAHTMRIRSRSRQSHGRRMESRSLRLYAARRR